MAKLRLIVGLGNPGAAYAQTRHNIGAAFVRDLAQRFGLAFAAAGKASGEVARGAVAGVDARLLLPAAFMNESGQAVGPYARYFRIAPQQILVAHDEVAFPPGVVRLKSGGGDNGHNGVKSVAAGLGDRGFHRLRIGVGHPGGKEKMLPYLTEWPMPAEERAQAEAAYRLDEAVLAELMQGALYKAMNLLHRPADGMAD